MTTLDSSILNVSLPTIANALHAGLSATQWVSLSYMLGIAVLLLPAGTLSDSLGRRKTLCVGICIFIAGSFLCGLANSVLGLIATRAFQAMGASLLMANGPAIISEAFPNTRGRALGLTMVAVSMGTMTGPILGGWIVNTYSWPWIFFLNIPIGVIALFQAWFILKPFDTPQKQNTPFDALGTGYSIVSLLSLMILLTYGLSATWSPFINWGLLGVSVLASVLFIHHETHTPYPLLDLSLFHIRPYTTACVASFLAFVGISSVFFLMPFYLEVILQQPPTMSGLVLMACTAALCLTSPLAGHLSDRFGQHLFACIGMLVTTVGIACMGMFQETTSLWFVVMSLGLIGIGHGLFHSPNNSQMLESAPPEALGVVGGMFAIARTLGMTIGVTLTGIIYLTHQAELNQTEGFLQAFHLVFYLASGLSLGNALWIFMRKEAA